LVTIRDMTSRDAAAVAQLHLDSWRSAYRGILNDAYLDGAAAADRRAHWARRLGAPAPQACGLVALLAARPVGFAYLIADADPTRGTLLDNLHVAPGHRGAGIGLRLLESAAGEVERRGWPRGLHLWVFDANAGARRFYERHGGRVVAQTLYAASDGGHHPASCYAWDDAADVRAP
jgi:GNAT superfamily N-acetyltransferase